MSWYTLKRIPTMTLRDFAASHALEMVVHKCRGGGFIASFDHVEIKNGAILESLSGRGATPDDAIEAYGAMISEKLLVVNAWKDDRREIVAPLFAKEPL